MIVYLKKLGFDPLVKVRFDPLVGAKIIHSAEEMNVKN